MSAYPLVLEGCDVSALVVGGGRVAARKVAALLDSGARVHVVAPRIDAVLEETRAATGQLRLSREKYDTRHLDGALLVVAATDEPQLNARIGEEARARGLLVNVVDAPELGNFVTPAVHRAGELVVAVTAGGVPSAAARIRDSIARTIDARYAEAVRELASLRRTLLDDGQRDRWREAATALLESDFCEQVESGRFAARIAEWR